MIQSYDLYMPTHLIFGKGRISELKDAVAGAGKKALITYGGGSVKRSGLFTRVKELLESAGCSVSAPTPDSTPTSAARPTQTPKRAAWSLRLQRGASLSV